MRNTLTKKEIARYKMKKIRKNNRDGYYIVHVGTSEKHIRI